MSARMFIARALLAFGVGGIVTELFPADTNRPGTALLTLLALVACVWVWPE